LEGETEEESARDPGAINMLQKWRRNTIANISKTIAKLDRITRELGNMATQEEC
jgi:hypothetical protein